MNLEQQVRSIIELAFSEDRRDLTSNLLFSQQERLRAGIVSKAMGVVCGVTFAAMALRRMDPSCIIRVHKKDGTAIRPGDLVLSVKGRARALLSAERKAVNFIQHLSGLATLTAKFVQAVRGTRARIFDTRKTIPGVRLLQKYAVLCGGGQNHRLNLSQMALVKDNHLSALNGRWSLVTNLRRKLPRGTLLEIEAKTIREVFLAIKAQADIIMLDNMTIPRLKKSVSFIRKNSKAQIEISGGITLKNVHKIARLGVERISVGALTHSAPALDLSMEIYG